MKLVKTLVASAALIASFGANALVTASLGGGYGTFLSLSSAGLNGGSVATLSGGTIYTNDQPFADIPAGVVYESKFLAAGPTSGTSATLSFVTPVDYISFLWGSPDIYNQLTVTSNGATGGSQLFTTSMLGLPGDGNQGFSRYVQFAGIAGSQITSLAFNNDPSINAFESANYSLTPVPEPETYALMLAGLGAMGFMARRRKSA